MNPLYGNNLGQAAEVAAFNREMQQKMREGLQSIQSLEDYKRQVELEYRRVTSPIAPKATMCRFVGGPINSEQIVIGDHQHHYDVYTAGEDSHRDVTSMLDRYSKTGMMPSVNMRTSKHRYRRNYRWPDVFDYEGEIDDPFTPIAHGLQPEDVNEIREMSLKPGSREKMTLLTNHPTIKVEDYVEE